MKFETFLNSTHFLKMLTLLSDIFEIETISMSADTPGQVSKMAYLHQKRIFVTQKGQNES